jgi:hypothetical protein
LEISIVKRRLTAAIDRSRRGAQERRQRVTEAEREYATFLEHVATPVARMMANALKVEGYPFTMFTPSGAVRLASDKGRDDYIELALDTTGSIPEVVGRVSRGRGSRTISDERPLKTGASPNDITEEDVLEFLLKALEPWLER